MSGHYNMVGGINQQFYINGYLHQAIFGVSYHLQFQSLTNYANHAPAR